MGFIPAFANVHRFCTLVSNLDAVTPVVTRQNIGSRFRGDLRSGRTNTEVVDRTGGRNLRAEGLAITVKLCLLANMFFGEQYLSSYSAT
jgi:hypothetical protein